jgi:hypothetical protein
MKTLIVNYATPADKDQFIKENASVLNNFDIIYAHGNKFGGIAIEAVPESN